MHTCRDVLQRMQCGVGVESLRKGDPGCVLEPVVLKAVRGEWWERMRARGGAYAAGNVLQLLQCGVGGKGMRNGHPGCISNLVAPDTDWG